MQSKSYTQALAQTLQTFRVSEQEWTAGAKLCDKIVHCNMYEAVASNHTVESNPRLKKQYQRINKH